MYTEYLLDDHAKIKRLQSILTKDIFKLDEELDITLDSLENDGQVLTGKLCWKPKSGGRVRKLDIAKKLEMLGLLEVVPVDCFTLKKTTRMTVYAEVCRVERYAIEIPWSDKLQAFLAQPFILRPEQSCIVDLYSRMLFDSMFRFLELGEVGKSIERNGLVYKYESFTEQKHNPRDWHNIYYYHGESVISVTDSEGHCLDITRSMLDESASSRSDYLYFSMRNYDGGSEEQRQLLLSMLGRINQELLDHHLEEPVLEQAFRWCFK